MESCFKPRKLEDLCRDYNVVLLDTSALYNTTKKIDLSKFSSVFRTHFLDRDADSVMCIYNAKRNSACFFIDMLNKGYCLFVTQLVFQESTLPKSFNVKRKIQKRRV